MTRKGVDWPHHGRNLATVTDDPARFAGSSVPGMRLSATLKRLSSCAFSPLGRDGAMPSKRFDENPGARAVWLIREQATTTTRGGW